MSKRELTVVCGFVSIVLMLVNVNQAAAYVTPQIGGGTVDQNVAPMIMPIIDFSNSNIRVLDMMGHPWTALAGNARPIMRPLTGATLDPSKAYYNALNGMAWNWQYGWDSSGFNPNLIPNGGKIFIEMLSQSAGLSTYDKMHSYAPIFGTGTSSNAWMWDPTMGMAHNTYTVAPGYGEWSATYRIYIGDAATKAVLSGYGSDTVTLTWTSIPEPATMTLMGTGLVYLLGYRRKHKTTA
jgi:hypothetical protein